MAMAIVKIMDIKITIAVAQRDQNVVVSVIVNVYALSKLSATDESC